MQLYAVGTD